jgi:hypothetical protein
MLGKLNVYKVAQEEFADALDTQDDKYAEYSRLVSLTEEEVASQFPDGGYEEAVTSAASDYAVAREAAVAAEIASDDSLAVLTGGRELSDEALAELGRLLDL